jgi:hypothetical protein
MNNKDPLTEDQIRLLYSSFLISGSFFIVMFELLHLWYDRKSRQETDNVCFKEYATWNPQKKADFISRIVSQVHAIMAIVLAIKSVFFTW